MSRQHGAHQRRNPLHRLGASRSGQRLHRTGLPADRVPDLLVRQVCTRTRAQPGRNRLPRHLAFHDRRRSWRTARRRLRRLAHPRRRARRTRPPRAARLPDPTAAQGLELGHRNRPPAPAAPPHRRRRPRRKPPWPGQPRPGQPDHARPDPATLARHPPTPSRSRKPHPQLLTITPKSKSRSKSQSKTAGNHRGTLPLPAPGIPLTFLPHPPSLTPPGSPWPRGTGRHPAGEEPPTSHRNRGIGKTPGQGGTARRPPNRGTGRPTAAGERLRPTPEQRPAREKGTADPAMPLSADLGSSQPKSNSPPRTPAVNASHSAGVKARTGPPLFLESRTATVPGRLRATSTHVDPLAL